MKNILEVGFKEFMDSKLQNSKINESSLSRLWKHNETMDCGALTAFRKYNNCGYQDNGEPCGKEPILLTKKENQKRNLALASDLKGLGYGVTKLIGTYPEGGKTVKEISYFVTDLENSGDLERNLKRLGEKYNQDSVLYIPKGAINNNSKAYLIGTNNCCNNWLDYGSKEVFNKSKLGYDSPIYTSKVNGKPFIFETLEYSDELFGSGSNSVMASRFAKDYDKGDNNE